MVAQAGVEPASPGYGPGVLPLHDRAIFIGCGYRFCPYTDGVKVRCAAVNQSALWSRWRDSNPRQTALPTRVTNPYQSFRPYRQCNTGTSTRSLYLLSYTGIYGTG